MDSMHNCWIKILIDCITYVSTVSKNIHFFLTRIIFTPSQKVVDSKICTVFLKKSRLLTKPAFIWSKIQQKSNILKYLYYLK